MTDMLIHIVCWKYKPEIDAATRDDHRKKLGALPSMIPNIEAFDVGADILDLDRSFDTGLVAHFADRDALDEYTIHPEHQAVAAIGKQISENAISVDFFRDE
ncbi:MAG: Dabb family protein [Pyrinomonadaceae bacterium]